MYSSTYPCEAKKITVIYFANAFDDHKNFSWFLGVFLEGKKE